MSAAKPPRGDSVREALIAAAFQLFGEKGFEATSTREIAAAANSKTAMIAYYFGGKDGLRAACITELGERFTEAFAASEDASLSPAEARRELIAAARMHIREFIDGEKTRAVSQFLMREALDPSPVYLQLNDSLLAPLHQRGLALWARATGADPASADAKLCVSAMLGQVAFFSFSRASVMARMGWSEIGPREIEEIEAVLVANLEASLDAATRRAS